MYLRNRINKLLVLPLLIMALWTVRNNIAYSCVKKIKDVNWPSSMLDGALTQTVCCTFYKLVMCIGDYHDFTVSRANISR